MTAPELDLATLRLEAGFCGLDISQSLAVLNRLEEAESDRVELTRRTEQVLAMHGERPSRRARSGGTDGLCRECGLALPCPTLRALDREEAR